MLDELQHDYGMHINSDSDKPLFHRIKFEGASIYLTRASYYDKIVNTGSTSMGDYRIFSWQDWRAQAFLGFELGQESPVLGSANLIGSFKPTLDDLTEVKYSTFDGKAYYDSAKDAIANPGKKLAPKGDATARKIDADTFMKMNEIIPTGLQGKAIYGEGNYIIDGPAGTGKSTTVLQKIKLLQLHNNVKSNDICLIVKNQQVVQPFNSLLESIGINNIKTYSQQGFVEAFYPNEMTLTAENMQDVYLAVKNLVTKFETVTNLSDLVSLQPGSAKLSPPPTGSDEFERGMKSLIEKCDDFLAMRVQLNKKMSKLRKTNADESNLFKERQKNKLVTDKKKKLRAQTIGQLKKEISDDVSLFEENLTKKVLGSKKKGILSRIGITNSISELDLNDRTSIRGEVKEYETLRSKELDKKNSEVDNSTFELDLGDESYIRNLVKEYENKKKGDLDRKSKENKDLLKLKMDELEGIKKRLITVFSSIDNVDKAFKGSPQETVSSSILQRMIRKSYQASDDFHTIIIDEAQDVTAVTIELVRLKAKNTILVGDESQRELVGGVGHWQDVISARDAFLNKEGGLNIYSLRHNFRQTYELGAVSYNYRQLTLNKPIEDIKEDYFEDQIGYFKPSLKIIDSHSDFHQLIDSKISYIKERFTKTFPLVVFYENDKSRDRLNDILGSKFITLIGDDMSSECDILLVSSKNIAGREFPVVIAPLTASTKNSTVYVMMSRAKIDLTLVLAEGRKPNVHIDKLCNEKLITKG